MGQAPFGQQNGEWRRRQPDKPGITRDADPWQATVARTSQTLPWSLHRITARKRHGQPARLAARPAGWHPSTQTSAANGLPQLCRAIAANIWQRNAKAPAVACQNQRCAGA